MKILQVINRLVSAERHVEFAVAIEPAKTVETSPIQEIEELRRLLTRALVLLDELVESITMTIENRFGVFHLNGNQQTVLKLFVEIYEVRIDVV